MESKIIKKVPIRKAIQKIAEEKKNVFLVLKGNVIDFKQICFENASVVCRNLKCFTSSYIIHLFLYVYIHEFY